MKKFFAISFALITLTACGTREPQPFDKLAQCLTDAGAIMYGADTCPHCKDQKKAFQGSFDLINYVECRKEGKRCEEARVVGYPTWEIDGMKYPGKRSLSELAELSNCPLQ